MSPTVYLALYGWIPFIFHLFSRFPLQRAVVIASVGGALFLPQTSIKLPGLPDYGKTSVPTYGIILATLVFDPERLQKLRPSWLDIPVLVFCFSPMISSITNGLGPYDGLSTCFGQVVAWGLPYLIGRMYLADLDGLKILAEGIAVGGLMYVPLCLYEIRMSPQLHAQVYGFAAFNDFAQSIRMGGYRPTVFMYHGLMVALWMMSATLLTIWLWRNQLLKPAYGLSATARVVIILVTFVLLKSTGAYYQLFIGVCLLFAAKYLRTALPTVLLILWIVFHLYVSSSGLLTSSHIDKIVELGNKYVGPERTQSLEFRLRNEEILSAKARQKPVFGWGGWGRSRVHDEYGKDITVTDSLWIVVFGPQGYVGVISMAAIFLLPTIVFIYGPYPAKTWKRPEVAPAAGIMICIVLALFDSLFNAVTTPVFIIACGGLAGLVLKPASLRSPLPLPSAASPDPTIQEPVGLSPQGRGAIAVAAQQQPSRLVKRGDRPILRSPLQQAQLATHYQRLLRQRQRLQRYRQS